MQKVSISPALLRQAMKVSRTRSVEATIRTALTQMVEREKLRELENRPRLTTVRAVRRAARGRLVELRGTHALRRLTGV